MFSCSSSCVSLHGVDPFLPTGVGVFALQGGLLTAWPPAGPMNALRGAGGGRWGVWAALGGSLVRFTSAAAGRRRERRSCSSAGPSAGEASTLTRSVSPFLLNPQFLRFSWIHSVSLYILVRNRQELSSDWTDLIQQIRFELHRISWDSSASFGSAEEFRSDLKSSGCSGVLLFNVTLIAALLQPEQAEAKLLQAEQGGGEGEWVGEEVRGRRWFRKVTGSVWSDGEMETAQDRELQRLFGRLSRVCVCMCVCVHVCVCSGLYIIFTETINVALHRCSCCGFLVVYFKIKGQAALKKQILVELWFKKSFWRLNRIRTSWDSSVLIQSFCL